MLSTRLPVAASHASLMIRRGQAVLQCLHRRQASFSTVPHPAVSDSDEWTSARPYSEVPGPKPMPVLGNAWRFLPVIGTFNATDFHRWATDMHKQYGDIVKISGIPGREDMVFVYTAKTFEKIFRNEGKWPSRFETKTLYHYRTITRSDFFRGHQGLANENGESWQKMRTVVNPALMQPKNAKMYVSRMDQVARDFVGRIPKLRDSNQEMPADFANELHKWSLESIALIALDARLGCLADNLPKNSDSQKMIDAVDFMFNDAFDLEMQIPLWKYIDTPLWKKNVEHNNIFLEICLKYIEEAKVRAKSKPEGAEASVLEQIMERDPSTKRAVIMAIDMIMAGIDTTSNTTAITMYHLAKNQEKQALLHQELQQLIPDPSAPLTAQQLDATKYLKACIKESTRMCPVTIGNSRILKKDIVIENYQIPKGSLLMMFNSLACQTSEQFPEPQSYLPERWLKNREGSVVSGAESCLFPDHKAHPFAYLPFGFGPRQCVGMRFANLEMETLLARIFRNFKVEYNHGDMVYKCKLLYTPDKPLQFKITDWS